MELESDDASQLAVVPSDPAVLIHEVEGFSRRTHADPERSALGRKRDIQLLIGTQVLLEPALSHRIQRAVTFKLGNDLIHCRQQLLISLRNSDGGVLIGQGFRQRRKLRVLLCDLKCSRIGRDDSLKLPGLHRTDRVHDVVEALDFRLRKPCLCDGFPGGSGHDADLCVLRVVEASNDGVVLTAGAQEHHQ